MHPSFIIERVSYRTSYQTEMHHFSRTGEGDVPAELLYCIGLLPRPRPTPPESLSIWVPGKAVYSGSRHGESGPKLRNGRSFSTSSIGGTERGDEEGGYTSTTAGEVTTPPKAIEMPIGWKFLLASPVPLRTHGAAHRNTKADNTASLDPLRLKPVNLFTTTTLWFNEYWVLYTGTYVRTVGGGSFWSWREKRDGLSTHRYSYRYILTKVREEYIQ